MIDHADPRTDAISLTVHGRPVADYVWQPRLPATVSPRPFLHPVRTLAGTEVTELMPDDHLHHLGVSVAIPDVNGANFWGGRTFIPAQGSVSVANHGTQRHVSWVNRTSTDIVHHLTWIGNDGAELLRERRQVATLPVNADAWALDLTFELTNVTGAPLAFASPATNGRPGAGYAGFFWRARRGTQRINVLGPCGTGEKVLHGQRTPWLALTGVSDRPWTLIFMFVGEDDKMDRWFVRSRDYAGVGSSLAWDHPLVVASGHTVRRRIITVVVDGRLNSQQAATTADAVAAHLAGTGSQP